MERKEYIQPESESLSMARRAIVQPTLRLAGLSLAAKRAAIPKLQRRLDELAAFDPASVESSPDPRVTTLRQAVERTLTDIFGPDTVEYERYRVAAHLANDWFEGQSSIGLHRKYLSEDKATAVATLQGIIAAFREDIEAQFSEDAVTPSAQVAPPLDLSKVFVVHGHDGAVRESVARFIGKLGLEAIILHECPNKGRTIITKFREEAVGVGFAVVLMTPDDLGGKPPLLVGVNDFRPRARQNVVFELGFFIGALGPDRVAALVKGDIERPSDFDGVVYISLDSGSWQVELGRELKEAGYAIDWNKVMG